MNFLLTKEKFYDKIFIEIKKGEQKTMKKKWDKLEKKWNARSIQEKARGYARYHKEELYSYINEFGNKRNLPHRFTKAYLRALKKLAKQERGIKDEIQRT